MKPYQVGFIRGPKSALLFYSLYSARLLASNQQLEAYRRVEAADFTGLESRLSVRYSLSGARRGNGSSTIEQLSLRSRQQFRDMRDSQSEGVKLSRRQKSLNPRGKVYRKLVMQLVTAKCKERRDVKC